MQIQISWLLQKPADFDLHCLQGQDTSGFSRTRVNKFMYSINKVIKCGTWQPVKFQLVSVFELDQKLNVLSYLWINVGNMNLEIWYKIHFVSRTRDLLKFYRLSGATFYDCINTIYHINLLKLSWIIKCLFLRYMEPLSYGADKNSLTQASHNCCRRHF